MRTMWLTIIVSLCLAGFVMAADEPEAGAVDDELIEKMLESFDPDPQTQRLIDAVLHNPVRDIAINKKVFNDHNPYFSHEIKTGKITDQKSTGRCWLYAGLNILRPAVIDKIDDSSFEFSQNYLFFWDKIEKANTFLEKVIARRKLDVRDEDFQRILERPVGDGGWWEYFANLVKKYGVVPASAMPETRSTKTSRMMDRYMTYQMREDAAELRAMSAKGASVKKLRQKKEEFLLEIYKVLTFHLGTPPTEFTYRYKSSVDEEKRTAELIRVINAITDGEGGGGFTETEALKEMAEDKVSVLKSYTPQEFAEEYVTADLDEYIVLGNDPSREMNKRYIIENDRNIFEQGESGYVNVSIEDLKLATLQSVLSDEPVWFGADVTEQRENGQGIMNSELYLYDDIYGLKTVFTKADRMLYQTEATNHAMVFIGVDVVNDKPMKWKVENSWGNDVGDAGFYTMYSNWFDEYVIQSIINKKYLPQRILDILDTKPVLIREHEFIAKIWMR
ncbi:hypothetical protein CEE37_09265 [candidate division LCP-89 bacterium B3_LCP]|uniref:Aminopeptidase n=1 Tax=candidate division LCP-89 bacterium B3_LCP TaxID=2012998 RepID=A0A532V020_UNCL8|nr:MAG: hypothetical protein CEE37_09265 [candidate division LCP-89 bacterium B3_LCP]